MSQTEKSSNFGTGAVRSADANHLDFTSLPIIGLIGVAKTASEGGAKYGRLNYMQGMPIHDTINHSLRHIYMFLTGDRSEPHLEHACWGLMAASQQNTLDPDLSAPHLLGPGATITAAVQAHLDANRDDLAARRKAGEFAGIGDWSLRDLPEIQTILKQRDEEEADEENVCKPRRPWKEVVAGVMSEYLKEHGKTYSDAQGEAVAHDEEDHLVAPNPLRDQRQRFRVEHPDTGEKRIACGVVRCNNYPVPAGCREFEHVLIVGRPEHEYALMSQALCNKRVLCVSQSDWDFGTPFEIDSAWGYATASAKSSRIKGEVTRTMKYPMDIIAAQPLPDEEYVDFCEDRVRVYFKKPA